MILSVLGAVYFDVKQTRSIVALKPKPPFVPIFQVAVTKEGSGIHIIQNKSSNSESRNSSVFMVETGEDCSPFSSSQETTHETTLSFLLDNH
jgi:site-specific DNA recombinase